MQNRSADRALADFPLDPVLRAIASRGQVRVFPANAVIISEGDVGDSLYIVLSGKVKVFSSDSRGKEVILATHGPGEYVGEMSLNTGPRSASVMTVGQCTCAVVTRGAFADAISQNPQFAVQLINDLIQRLRGATENVKGLALMDVYGRVAHLLLSLAEERDGETVIAERLTQQDIADRIGASREMVSRILKDLSTGGYISVTRRRITVNKKPPSRW